MRHFLLRIHKQKRDLTLKPSHISDIMHSKQNFGFKGRIAVGVGKKNITAGKEDSKLKYEKSCLCRAPICCVIAALTAFAAGINKESH